MRRFTAVTCLWLAACSSSAEDAATPASDPTDATAEVSAIDSATSDTGTQDTTTTGEAASDVTNPGDGAAPGSTGQWVLGYYVGYQIDHYPLASIDWSGMSHIALAPLTVNADGSINTRFANFGSDADGATFAKQLSTAAHAHGVKALLMLGGAGLSNNVKPAMSSLDAFVGRLLKTMTDLGYDGIDLDVEAENFSLDDAITLAAALRAARPGMLLSYPGSTVQYNQTVDPRIVKLATYLDRYAMQHYMGGNAGMFTGSDGAGGRFESWFYGALGGVAAHRPYAIDYALGKLAEAGIPKNKLAMGIAFYAACYRIPATTPPGGGDVSGPRMPTNAPSSWCWDCGIGGGDNDSSYNTFYAADGVLGTSTAAERRWDDVAQEPYLSFAAAKSVGWCGGNTRFVTYEDEQSIKAKGAFSKTNGYGGVIVWTINQGWLPASAAGGRPRNALMQALRQGFLVP